MTAQFARGPYRGRAGGSTASEPHAALLIDFDNVTMGIRSDLTKELKNLLNSDIIKGKVAVQRAYADWRRYPQYIVPLAESSVDLIFAPAYGSAKKNATDIRLAIDAVELVFTRPEIGTIILLSGDSDFSSLVLKLKEYGKYVIGVGIRESASDLLVQNCDEYYSYSALTGLTRAGEEAPAISEDPWELVEMGLRQMIENDDVMRSDRLKQVLLEMDPGFDEKALGFQKFNKFLQEAANRGIISLRKQENGQYEVGPPAAGEDGEARPAEPREPRAERDREGRGRRGRRGRGRRDEREGREPRERDGDERPAREQLELDEDASVAAAAVAEAEPAAPAAAAQPAEAKPAAAKPAAAKPAESPAEAPVVEAAPAEPVDGGRTGSIAASYDLLRRAVSELTKKSGPAVRDSDVKRRMLELQGGWDEAALGFSKFSRFLRTAHGAEVITLRKGDNGVYDVLLGDGGVHVDAPVQEERGGRRERGRGRDRDRDRGPRSAAGGDGVEGAAQATTPAPEPAAVTRPEKAPESAAEQPAASAPRETQATPPATRRDEPAVAARAQAPAPVGRFRRGSRGPSTAGGPPPLLEGQTARVPKPAGEAPAAAAPAEVAPAAPAAPAASAPAAEPAKPAAQADAAPAADAKQEQPRGRGRKPAKQPADKQPAGQPAAKQPAAKQPAAKQAAAKQAKPEPKPAKKGAEAGKGGPRLDAAALGLPTQPEEMVTYMSSAYAGIGPKTVQNLIDEFGAGRLYEVLERQPDRVREKMGGARADKLIDAFADDLAARRANAAPDSRSQIAQAQKSTARKGGRPAGPRGGGRSGARKQPRRK